MMTFEDIKNNKDIRTYITEADNALDALGFSEHSFAHVTKVAESAAYILKTLCFDERLAELAKIAGFLHDIGNLVNRTDHSQSGAVMAFRILNQLGMDATETAAIVSAIGNHDEGTGTPVSPLAAALIIADKSDVRRTRVKKTDISTFDIHDRVNYAVSNAELIFSDNKEFITLSLTIDTHYCSVMDYFEIFLERMVLCRKSATALGVTFRLVMNGQQVV